MTVTVTVTVTVTEVIEHTDGSAELTYQGNAGTWTVPIEDLRTAEFI